MAYNKSYNSYIASIVLYQISLNRRNANGTIFEKQVSLTIAFASFLTPFMIFATKLQSSIQAEFAAKR